MFFGLAWYWWLIIAVIFALSIPLKVKFMRWWNKRRVEKRKFDNDTWGDEIRDRKSTRLNSSHDV